MSTPRALNFFILISAISTIVLDYFQNDLYRIFKPLTTILIILIPILYGSKSNRKYWLYTVIALIFCLGGDTLLMWEDKFVFGLASFLIGHFFFILSFISIDKFRFHATPLIILLIYGASYYVYLYSDLGALAIPVFVYVLVILLMGWQGIGLYIWKQEKAYQLIAAGVILFIVSDSVLALNKFKIPFELSGIVVLSTYWLAIGLLANATCLIKKGPH